MAVGNIRDVGGSRCHVPHCSRRDAVGGNRQLDRFRQGKFRRSDKRQIRDYPGRFHSMFYGHRSSKIREGNGGRADRHCAWREQWMALPPGTRARGGAGW